MNYEEKYRKALKRAKRLHSEPIGGTERIVCEQIFPELRWSEDERIRQAIIKGLSSCGKKYWGGFEVKAAIAWLKKKGEQKQEEQPRYNIGDILCDLSCNEYDKDSQLKYEIIDIKNGTYICDNGSIPVSQQDEYKLVAKKAEQKPVDNANNDKDSVSNELREASFIFAARQMVHKASPEERKLELIYSFEEGAKWKEGQFEMEKLKHCELKKEPISGLDNGNMPVERWEQAVKAASNQRSYRSSKGLTETRDDYFVDGVQWADEHPKVRQTWEPSDEQMDALNYVVNLMASSGSIRENDYYYNVLKDLREQLKKLK